MKKMLVFENKEKRVIEDASALINNYCGEMPACEECPFNELCTRIHDSDRELNVPIIFEKAKNLIC